MNITIGIIIFIVVVGGGAIVLIIVGLRNPQSFNEDAMQNRLDEFTQGGEQVNLEKLEMAQPLSERVLLPLARAFGEFAIRFTPQAALENTRRKIEMSGIAKLDPTTLLAGQFILAAVLGGVILLVFSIGATKPSPLIVLLLVGGFGFLGFYIPTLLVQSKLNSRQKSIRKAMPDALDLLTICVEAGLGFESAMQQVSEKWETELSLGFARVNREIQLGKTQREALRDMADRLGIPELTSFVTAVIQSTQLGVSLAKVLRVQSEQMRIKRRQLAEQEAHKAPIKMLIPMALLILPALCIVLLSPAAFKVMTAFSGGLLK